jgi:hypothetical protein
MKKSLLSLILSFCLFGHSFAQWQKANLPASNAILSLAVDYATSYVYAGSEGNGVYLSADTGATWKTANTGLPANLNVSNILIQNKNIFLATNDGVYLSANKGIRWEQAGLKSILVNSFTSYSSGDTTFLYAGTEKGIYLTKNNGQSWSIFAFPGFGVSAVLSVGSANFYAGKETGGLDYYADYHKNWVTDACITSNTIIKSLNINMLGASDSYTFLTPATNHGAYYIDSKGNWVPIKGGLSSDTIVNTIISTPDMLRSRNYGYFSIYNIALAGTGTTIDKGNVYSNGGVPGYYNWTALSTGIDGEVKALAIQRNIVFAGGSSLWVLNSDMKYLDVSDSIGVMPAVGDTATFKIITNDSWFILNSTNDKWITFSPSVGTGDATITVTATPNNTNNMRLGSMSINAQNQSPVYFYQAPANTTGIDNPSNTNITIYPVPVKDDLVISFPNQSDNTRFAISNLSGMELLAAQLTGNTTKVNMSGFNPGVYVLKIYSGDTCITRKIIKQ